MHCSARFFASVPAFILAFLFLSSVSLAENPVYESIVKAVENSELEKLKGLVKKDIDYVNTVNSRGENILSIAASNGQLRMVKFLIENGAELDKRDKLQWTPLMWAVHSGKVTVLNYLIKKGAKLDISDKYGWTPLMQSAFMDRPYCAEILLENGAEFESKNVDNDDAISIALQREHNRTFEVIIKFRDKVQDISL